VRREFKRHLFVVDSLDKQMQNEKELIRLASAGVGGLFFVCVGSNKLDLTCLVYKETEKYLGHEASHPAGGKYFLCDNAPGATITAAFQRILSVFGIRSI
jgi:hypothetical protein